MSGQTVKDIASPYVQMMARETGRAYTDLDPFTPQVKDALNRRGPDGTASPMSLSEFQQSIRSDPSWRGTQTAINSTMGVAGQVLQAMGLR